MPTLHIEGIDEPVTVSDSFLKKDAYEQQKIANDIASQYRNSKAKGVSDEMKSGGYFSETLQNVPGSAAKAGQDIYNTFAHPIQTGENIVSAVKNPSVILDYLKNRYGGMEEIKKSFHDDPVGVLLDFSTVLSGGETAAARLPVVGERASAALRAVNPVNVAAKGVGKAGSVVLGGTTGVGPDAIRQAFRAGQEGGPESQAFTEQMRGQASGAEMVNDAKNAVAQLRKERGAEYVQEMAKIGANKNVLKFDDIDKAVANTVSRFKGKSVSPSVEGVQNEIRDIVTDWKSLPDTDYHTAEGFDALKKRIGDVQQGLPFNTPQRLAADKVYNAVKDTIIKQDPGYGKIMKGYQTASDEIREVEKTLSLNPKANIDTSLRKITSALRNNVNTNFGRRKELVGFLARSGAPHLLAKIAGSSLSSASPRGLANISYPALLATAAAHPEQIVNLIMAVPATSPRLVGEAAHAAGRASRLPVRSIGLGGRILSPSLQNPEE